jgi:hypothetical protein
MNIYTMEDLIREGGLTAQEAALLADALERAADQAQGATGPIHPAEPMPEMDAELSGLAADAHDATLATGMREPGETHAEFLDRVDTEPASDPTPEPDREPEMEAGS